MTTGWRCQYCNNGFVGHCRCWLVVLVAWEKTE